MTPEPTNFCNKHELISKLWNWRIPWYPLSRLLSTSSGYYAISTHTQMHWCLLLNCKLQHTFSSCICTILEYFQVKISKYCCKIVSKEKKSNGEISNSRYFIAKGGRGGGKPISRPKYGYHGQTYEAKYEYFSKL